MKKVLPALFACGFCLYAADFWQKPATEWTDKDVQKMLNNSPWAKPFSISTSGPSAAGLGSVQGNAGGGDAAPISEGGGGRGGGRGGGGGGAAPAVGGGASVELVARWQSAAPEKQAFVRNKFGEKAGTSEEAKQILEHEEPGYVIIVAGNLRPFMRTNPEGMKKIIQDNTALTVKGKEPLKLLEIQGAPTQLMFVFSKAVPLTLDDKEVDFTTKVADVVLKYKFKLKDMVVNGKLEL
jgi:hypothetical protein